MRSLATEIYTCLNRRYANRVFRETADDTANLEQGYCVFRMGPSGPADYAGGDPSTLFDSPFVVTVTYYVDTADEADTALENIIDDFHHSEWALSSDSVAYVSLTSQEVTLDPDKQEEGIAVWRATSIWEIVLTTI